ncbi:Gfo/Idh/MocA family oxidoreductase [Symbiopectobacterium sp.]|uniref:Gfo/Idh/MocA family oxidoreductase n=1 Tax=Symbiopectobacterium sp. TaxID=2952789 RepID=UPI003F3C4BF0
MTSKMKAVVCGTAFGRFYLRALAIHPDIELVGILSRGSETSARCAYEMGIAHYHSVDALPDTVTLACVVVRAGVSGGSGAEIACELLRRGIHVLQEHPLHPDELAHCFRTAHQYGVRYDVNAFYPHIRAVMHFLQAAALLRKQQPIAYLEGVCGAQVLYPWLDMAARALGRLQPCRLTLTQPAHTGPYTAIQGDIGGVPVTLRVQNQIHPGDADNHAFLLHRMTLATESGVLTLADTHGPALWQPRLHTHRDATHRLVLDGPGTERLAAMSSSTLPGSEPDTFRSVFDTQWPQAINRALDAFIASIKNPALAQSQSAWALSVTRSWHQISTLLGPPALIEPATPPEVALCQQLCQQEAE